MSDLQKRLAHTIGVTETELGSMVEAAKIAAAHYRPLLIEAHRALEAMAGEVERLKDQNTAWADKYGDTQNAMYAALDERDRLKAALEPFAKLSTDRERQDPPEGTMRVRVVTAPEIEAARKALGGDAS